MSVQSGPTFKRYAANGVTTVYAIPFLLLDAADLLVTLDGGEVVSGFVLTGVGNPSSTCTFSAAPTGDLLFQLSIPFQRLSDYQDNGDLLSRTLNNDLDRLWLAIKQLSGGNDRALSTGVLEPEGIPALPVAAARALRLLAFDIDGNPIQSNLTLAQIEQQPALALDSAAAAAASAAAALVSQLNAEQSELDAAQSATNAGISETNAAATLNTAQKQIQTVGASVAANALSLSWTKTATTFRSATLNSGVVNNRVPPSNLVLTVPAGATLGTVSGVLARLVLLLLDNAGTVELAVVNLAGGNSLDESGLISTTAISAASNSANIIYSATARSNVPYRVAGFIDIAEATAGTWATAPTLVQGVGGEALSALSAGGYGQTWQTLTGARVNGTTYTNTTGKPIKVAINIAIGSATTSPRFQVNGAVVYGVGSANVSYVTNYNVYAEVPAGGTYLLDSTAGAISVNNWAEYR